MRWPVVVVVLMACGGDDPAPAPAPASASAPDETPTAGAPSGAGEDTSSQTGEPPAPPPVEHEGEATYYAAGTTGACGIKTPSDKLVGALGPSLYSKSGSCGQCAEVTGPKGSVTVLLNDRCGGCQGASMDLSTQAFTQIADKSQGRVAITWHYVDCP